MGRAPCCSKVGLHRGPWTSREDALLSKYIQVHGEGQWKSLPKRAGRLPGRTDNKIKNYWNTHLSKKLRNQVTYPNTHKKLLIDPTNKNNNGGKKKKNKNLKNDKKKGTKVQDQEKTIVYLPKPISVAALSPLPRRDSVLSLDSNVASASTSQEAKEANVGVENVGENEGFGSFDENHDIVNNSLDTLDELFEEYMELLRMEKNQEKLD